MTSGRRTRAEIIQIKKYIANLLTTRKKEIENNLGHVSPKKIQRIMEQDTGMLVKEQVIAKYLKLPDIENFSHITNLDANNEIQRIENLIEIARKQGKHTAVARYMSEKRNWLKQLAEDKVKIAEVNRPVYKTFFGHFENVKKKCPKCGHEFYELDDEEKGDGNKDRKSEKAKV